MEIPGVAVDPRLCNGCVVCMRQCRAGAIRVREGKAVILREYCVECGACFVACPQGAIRLRSTPLSRIREFRHPVATASPTLFSQFGYGIAPNQVLAALERLGFALVEDISRDCDTTAVAMEEYLLSHPDVRPGISPQCPVVVKLINKRFPSLIRNIVPIMPPRMLAARGLKARLSQKHGWYPQEIGAFVISPCAAKVLASQKGGAERLDGIIGIPEVYGEILRVLDKVPARPSPRGESAKGLAWAMSGGQAESFAKSHVLSVSGFVDVLRILEMVEAGRLADVDFIEAHICRGGCVSGPLTVENPYRAASVMKHLIRRHGRRLTVVREKLRSLLQDGYFDWQSEITPRPLPPLDPEPARAIEKMRRIHELVARLPGAECGVCGAPDCRTFAHDVVLGWSKESDCPYLEGRRAAADGERMEPMNVGEIAEALGLKVAGGKRGLGREVVSGYCSDLLSDVMANAPEGAVWLTVQTHQNVAAVAVLKDLAAVCLVGGRQPTDELLEKAEQEGMPILTTELDAFSLAGGLHKQGVAGGAGAVCC